MTKEEQKNILDALKPGMFVKVKGARDGVGIRRVVRIDNPEAEFPSVVCIQWSLSSPIWRKYPTIKTIYRKDQMTTHMLDKVTHIVSVCSIPNEGLDTMQYLERIPIKKYLAARTGKYYS